MTIKNLGIHRVKKKLADGSIKVHYYAWRGGPRMTSRPKDPEAFLAEYLKLTRERRRGAVANTMAATIESYRQSPAFERLAASTKRGYEPVLDRIMVKFGRMTMKDAERRGARAEFVAWRDTMADRPRSADMHMSVLSALLSFAMDRELIMRNPVLGVERLSSTTRADIIWSSEQLALAGEGLGFPIRPVFVLALETMQRQADLLSLRWKNIEGDVLTLVQQKTKTKVRGRLSARALEEIASLPRHCEHVLTSSTRQPWTSDGFRASWGREMKRLGIEGVTFHDLRGTAITLKHHEGWLLKDIALLSGHKERDAEDVIRRNYLVADLTTKV